MPADLSALDGLWIVYVPYLVNTLSPGPANMMVASVAMSRGRRAALVASAGVLTGSTVWATSAALGISALLARYAQFIGIMKLFGGLYLLFLAVKAARSALAAGHVMPVAPPPSGSDDAALYRRGLFLHLTNPKAILGWMAVMTLGLAPDSGHWQVAAIVGGCLTISICTFCAYALLFSMPAVVRAYARMRRGIEAALALVFGAAGLSLILSRS